MYKYTLLFESTNLFENISDKTNMVFTHTYIITNQTLSSDAYMKYYGRYIHNLKNKSCFIDFRKSFKN